MLSIISSNIDPTKDNMLSFNGLNRIMKARPLFQYKPEFYENLSDIFVREKGNIGTFPNDFLDLIQRGSNNLGERINRVQEILVSSNDILAEIEVKKLQEAEKINPKNFVTPFLPKLAKVDIQPERISKIFDEIRRKLMPSKDCMDEITDRAAKYIKSTFHELGILGEEDRVKITYILQGKFKNAFKLEIQDKNGNNIIHPKTILSFKDKNIAQEQYKKILELISKYYSSIGTKQYQIIINNLIENASRKVIPEEQKELYREVLTNLYEAMRNGKGEDKFKELLSKTTIREIQYNGIGVESNVTQFIKHAAGSPMIGSNYVPFYWLNLRKNVALSEFSDEALGEPTHYIHLDKYGLFHDDLDFNKNNEVLGRVVDYGNIKPLKELRRLYENSIIRRFFHKFSQIRFRDRNKTFETRIKYWNDLYQKAINHKIPNHNEILEALQLCKQQLPTKYHYKLSDSGSDVFI